MVKKALVSLVLLITSCQAAFVQGVAWRVDDTHITTVSPPFGNHCIILGGGAGIMPYTIGLPSNGTLLQGISGSDPSFISTPTLGIIGITQGTLTLSGLTSGSTTLYAPTTGGLTTFRFPGTLGTSGQVLGTDGAGTTTWIYPTSQANSSSIVDDSTNATMYPVWVSSNTGYQQLKITSAALQFNPSTNTLTAGNFNGTLNGNATSCTNATNSQITRDDTTNRSMNLVWIDPNNSSLPISAGNFPLKVSNTFDITYNPSISTLSCTNFNGTATTATTATITDDTTTNATMYPVWVTANTGNLPIKTTSTKLSWNPSTGLFSIVGSIFTSGNLTANNGYVHGNSFNTNDSLSSLDDTGGNSGGKLTLNSTNTNVITIDSDANNINMGSGGSTTGYLQINGKTSGALKINTADATAQTVTLSLAAQTGGPATITVPDCAGVNKTVAFSGASEPPSGTAGGDLGGTYPNPTVTSGAHLGAATIPDSALSANVPLLSAANTFTNNTIFGTTGSIRTIKYKDTDGNVYSQNNPDHGLMLALNNVEWYSDANTFGTLVTLLRSTTGHQLDVWQDTGATTRGHFGVNNLLLDGLITKANGVSTTGTGTPLIYASDRKTGQIAAVNLAAVTVGASDASYIVSSNVLITGSSVFSFTVTCSYTDEGNTSRVLTMQFSSLAGAMVTTITNAAGSVPYEGTQLHIRCKSGTTITIGSTGTFSTVTYNIEENIMQVK